MSNEFFDIWVFLPSPIKTSISGYLDFKILQSTFERQVIFFFQGYSFTRKFSYISSEGVAPISRILSFSVGCNLSMNIL